MLQKTQKMLDKSIISVGKNLPNLPTESGRTHQQRSRRTVLLRWQECAGEQRQQPQRRDGAEATESPVSCQARMGQDCEQETLWPWESICHSMEGGNKFPAQQQHGSTSGTRLSLF